MDIITYALSKKIAAHALSGVQSMSINGQTLIINTKDSGVLTMTFPTPKDGVSVTDIDVNANNQIVFTMSDGSEIISGKIPTVKGDPGEKGDDGFSPTIIENADNTDKIYKLDITTADSTFTTPNLKGADGQGGTGGSGEENKIDSISVNGVNVPVDENKNVDIAVPDAYDDTALSNRVKTIEDDYAKSSDIPSLSGYATETWVNEQGFLTEHQDISGKVDKVDGKSLIADSEIERLASVDNYDDTALSGRVKTVEDEVPNLATKTYVGEQIASADHLKREIVTVLPSDENAKDNIIYMLKVESATGNDKYQEYMKIDGTVQMVGDTSVDLTDYAKTADVNTELGKKVNTTDIVDNLASDATDKPLSAAQGKVLDGKFADYTKTNELATVATSGSYNDLSDLPEFETVDIDFKTEY